MPYAMPSNLPVPSSIPEIPIDLPLVQIERPELNMPATVPGFAPRVWPGPEPFWPDRLDRSGQPIDERVTGPYRTRPVSPYWVEKITAGYRGQTIQPSTMRMPTSDSIPGISIAPWRIPQVLPPERVGPFSISNYGGGI